VFEELGAHLAGGPVLWTALAAEVVPEAADGAVRVTGLELDDRTSGPFVVAHGAESDVLLVLRPDGIERCELDRLEGQAPGTPMDPLTPVVVLPSIPRGDVVADADASERLGRHGAVLAAALLVGGAQAVLDVARDHALERHQFGVPIGSFQAIKHLLADCYVRVEMARAATCAAAAVAAGRGDGDPDLAASSAKHLAGEAARSNSRTAIQVLGGMGFTWDLLPHLFLKRSWVLDHTFGTGAVHAARLGAAVGIEVASA
jgi:hypothetical protein